MAAINVLFNAALKLPVVYVNLIVDDIVNQHIRSYDEAKTHSFLESGKKINSSTYDNQKMSSIHLPRLSTTL